MIVVENSFMINWVTVFKIIANEITDPKNVEQILLSLSSFHISTQIFDF